MIKNNTINKKALFSVVYLIVCILVFTFNQRMLNGYNSMAIYTAFFVNLSLLLLVVLNNGFDILFLFLFCLDYLLVPIMVQYFTGSSYGILEKNSNSLYMPELLTDIFIYNMVIIFLSLLTNFSKKEHSLVQLKEKRINNITVQVNNLIAVTFAIVAFPRLGFSTGTSGRFDMLLPGHAWNQLAIIALLFNLSYFKSKWSVKLSYFFVIAWFLIDGERADITGLVLGLVIYSFLKEDKLSLQEKAKKVIYAFIFIFLFAILLNLIIALRENISEINVISLIKKIFVTPTTADVGYLYNVSIDFIKKFNLLDGRIFIENLKSILPLSNSSGFGSYIVSAGYGNPGGEPLLAEPLMDFGVIGLYLIAFLDFTVFRLIVNFKNAFFKKEYLVILCLIPKIVWYGRGDAFTSILFFVPFMMLVDYVCNKVKFK